MLLVFLTVVLSCCLVVPACAASTRDDIIILSWIHLQSYCVFLALRTRNILVFASAQTDFEAPEFT